MTIEIRRHYVSISGEGEDYEGLVWKHDGRNVVYCGTTPEGFWPGLLVAYINGERVDFVGLDAALAASGLPPSRDIVK